MLAIALEVSCAYVHGPLFLRLFFVHSTPNKGPEEVVGQQSALFVHLPDHRLHRLLQGDCRGRYLFGGRQARLRVSQEPRGRVLPVRRGRLSLRTFW